MLAGNSSLDQGSSLDTKGQEKATRGGEWEPIKISRGNLTYVLNLTQSVSLLTRSKPHSYRQPIDPRNQVRENEILAESQPGASKI
jgi:hypothetical protein